LNAGTVKRQLMTFPKPHHSYEFLRPKQKVGTLDLFAGIMVLVVWVAASGWIISSYGISWGIVVGIAVFWVFFVVVFRLVIGGLLD
jgi:hypothetical protein